MLTIKTHAKPALNNPVLIAGLPGIGNVSKLAVDFLVDKLAPELVLEITSTSFPPAVFIDDDDIIDLPSIKLYALKRVLKQDASKLGASGQSVSRRDVPKQDILILAGDIQPADEEASFELAKKIASAAIEMGCKQIITLGGVGRPQPPGKLRLYCAASSAEALTAFKAQAKQFKIHRCESISNIMGLAGLLVGEAKAQGISGVAILIDTFGHPMHFGIEESKHILELLKSLFALDIKPAELDDDLADDKKERVAAVARATKQRKIAEIQRKKSGAMGVSYIG